MKKNELKKGNKNHTSHIALHTSQNGITLIALIITIIVMLILVGVTINVALNGGLFTKASDASKQMQVEADRETLLSAVVAAIGYDGKVVIADIELPSGWTGSNGTYTSPKGNTFTVDENGKIEAGNGESNAEEPPTLELVQIDAGTYTDHTLIGFNISFSSFEQIYSILEQWYTNNKEEDGPDTFEQFLIESHNEKNETNYDNVEDTGMTLEELVSYCFFDGNSITENATMIVIEIAGTTFNITRPDGTTGTFTNGGSYSSSKDLEGIYYYSTLNNLECEGYCYSATQIGEYEITTTIGEYVLTDTITIENF